MRRRRGNNFKRRSGRGRRSKTYRSYGNSRGGIRM